MKTWVPDWRDESAYDSLKNASWGKWAWEFLRRNEEYQAEWGQVVTDCQRKGVPLSLTPLSRKLAHKWGLSEMIDPSEGGVKGRWVMSRYARRLTKAPNKQRSEYLDLNIRDKQAYGFDLAKPIGPQVKALREDLLALQRKLIEEGEVAIKRAGKKTGPLTLYLRILDARTAGASQKDILETLNAYEPDAESTEVERFKKNLIAARDLVNDGYMKLLLRG
jgi:hypothetical protein